jgi:predicted transcriptional regulator
MSLFFVGDRNIIFNKKLSAIDKIVYFALVCYMGKKDGKAYPRYATIKKETGLSRSSIQRAIYNLAKQKLITVKRLSSTNLYLLTQQLELEKLRLNRVKSLTETTDSSHRDLLIKPLVYNYNRFKNNNRNNYNRSFSNRGVAKHTIEYEGETYTECGREGHYVEYRNKKGNLIRKHTFKKDEPIKKFSAIEKVA